jgi:hypothetical protein
VLRATLWSAAGVRLTPIQLREALGLQKEAYRYWQRAIPALAVAKKGTSRARFDQSDLLATGLLKKLTELGIPIGRLSPIAPVIFESVRNTGWLQLERQTAVLYLDSTQIAFQLEALVSHTEPTIAIPMAPLVASCRQYLLDENDAPSQQRILFPPVSVASGGSR